MSNAQTPAHDAFHDEFLSEVRALVNKYRERFLIPPRWRIDIYVMCPDDMKETHYFADGVLASMAWEPLPNAQYRMRVRCDLDRQDLEWRVMHELLEAITAPYAEMARDLIDRTPGSVRNKATLDAHHRDVRDEIIEWFLDIIAPDKRPDVCPNV